jgi:pyruvate carboxylase
MSSRSIASEYRNRIKDDAVKYDEMTDYGYDDCKEYLIPESTVKYVLDAIESDVIDVMNILEHIEGLTEIDEAKDMLKVIAAKIY